jgi:hypothetical protein
MKMNSIFKPRDFKPQSYRLGIWCMIAIFASQVIFVEMLHVPTFVNMLIPTSILVFAHIKIKKIEKSNTYLMASPWFYILAFVCYIAMVLYIYTH